MASHKAKRDHRRFMELNLDDIQTTLNELPTEFPVDVADIAFAFSYLREQRANTIDAIFTGLQNRVNPLGILATVLAEYGMKEDDAALLIANEAKIVTAT